MVNRLSLQTLRALFAVALASLVIPSTGSATVEFVAPTPGSAFRAEELYDASLNVDISGIAASGTAVLSGDTTYVVVGIENYTTGCTVPGFAGQTESVYHVEYFGTGSLTAMVDVPAFSIAGLVLEANNFDYSGALWLRESDMALVAKERVISGGAILDFLGDGNFVDAGNIRIDQLEEYFPPLEELRFPLDTANPAYDQSTTVCYYGDINASLTTAVPIIGGQRLIEDFDEVFDYNFNISVVDERFTFLDGQRVTEVETFQALEGGPEGIGVNYSPDLGFYTSIRQSGVSLAGLLDLDNAVIEFVEAFVPRPAVPVNRSEVRVVDLVDGQGYDMWVAGSVSPLTNIGFSTVTDWLDLPAFNADVDFVPTGGSLTDSEFNSNEVFGNQTSSTFFLFDDATGVDAVRVNDNYSALPMGMTRFRAVHGAPAFGNVDIWEVSDPVNPVPVFTSVDFKDISSYVDFPARPVELGIDANADGVPDVTFRVNELPAGAPVTFVVGNETDGSPFLLVIRDGDDFDKLQPQPANEGYVRALHLSPGAPAVDVLADANAAVFEYVPFSFGTNYAQLPAGTYDLDVVPAGLGNSSSVLPLDGTAVTADTFLTLAVAGDLPNLTPIALVDDYTDINASFIRVRAIHASAAVGQVDVWDISDPLNPAPLATNLDFGDVGAYADFSPRPVTVGLDVDNDAVADLVYQLPQLPARTVANIFAVPDMNGAVKLLVQDNAGDTVVISEVEDPEVRVLHLSPNAPNVDIYIDGVLSGIQDLPFAESTPFVALPQGARTFDVVPAGATLGDSVQTVADYPLMYDSAYTFAAIGRVGEPTFRVLDIREDTGRVTPGRARIQAIHAAPSVGEVDLLNVTNLSAPSTILPNVAFGDVSAPLEIPVAPLRLGVDVDNDLVEDLTFSLPALPDGTTANLFIYETGSASPRLMVQLDDAVLIFRPEGLAEGGLEVAADYVIDTATGFNAFTIDIRLFNTTGTAIDMSGFVALEIFGVFYFYPSFSTAGIPAFSGLTVPNDVDTGFIPLYTLPLFEPLGTDVPVNVYGLAVNEATGEGVGPVSSDSVTLQ